MPCKTLAKFEIRLVEVDGRPLVKANVEIACRNTAEMALLYFELRNQLRFIESRVDEMQQDQRLHQLGIRGN